MGQAEVRLLVSAGEASGDTMLSLLLRALGARAAAAGLCGPASRQAGATCLHDLGATSVMGLTHALPHLIALHRLCGKLATYGTDTRVDGAVLVGFTSFHQRLGARLKRARIPVLWCAAPQVWAWRPSRLATLRGSVDHLAVILPFEEALWRAHNYAVRYVGHPAIELTRWRVEHPAQVAEPRLAVLCGSRAQEVRDTGSVLLEAAARWLDCHPRWGADVILAPALPQASRQGLAQDAQRLGLRRVEPDPAVGAAPLLHAYQLAFCVSGTASLEAVLAGTPPVIAYRCDPITAGVARALLRTRHIGLPNVLLDRPAFPELLQGKATARGVVRAGRSILAQWRRSTDACAQVRALLAIDDGQTFGERVARELDGLLRRG